MSGSTSATKAKGAVELREWFDEASGKVVPPQPGDTIDVLVEAVEDESGGVVLSYRKAKRQKEWNEVIAKYKEGDVVSGVVTRKIKGGLLVNIGVNVFLPASQVDIRRPPDIADYLGKTIECKIVIIDEVRHNIVVSRRKLIEDQRDEMKKRLLGEIEQGQIRKGVVKNIAEFGAFVDLGGIDGLLHITDMSWGRISNPNEVVKIDQELEVYIVKVDKEKERIALGLKQKTASPWADVEAKYPIGQRITGEVVNVMSYGAFVKLEPGIEGLVHISEMSWTRRINHPSEMLSIGDQIEVQVLNINKDKQEISLGIKQVQANPWDKVAEKYLPGVVITGAVRNLTNYGAFIEIEEGIDGLLARQRHELGPQGQPPQRSRQQGGQGAVRDPQRRSGTQARRPGHEANGQRSLGRRHSGPLPPRRRQDRQGHQAHQLRRLRRAGTRPGRALAHLRVGRAQGR